MSNHTVVRQYTGSACSVCEVKAEGADWETVLMAVKQRLCVQEAAELLKNEEEPAHCWSQVKNLGQK